MEFLAMLYTVLLVAICLMLALLLYRGNKPRQGGGDTEELKQWLTQQLEAQAKAFEQKQAAMAEQNYTAIRSVSETLQTAVQNMSSTLAQGQSGQQQLLTQRLQSLEAANTQKLEELRKTLADSMTALQAENTRKLDEIRHTVDEQLQDALQKRVSESFKAVNEQLEQVYKGLGEMQNLLREQRRRDDRQQEHRRGAHTTVQRVRWQRERYRAGGADAEIAHDAPLLHAELIHCGQHDARRQQTDGEGQRRN